MREKAFTRIRQFLASVIIIILIGLLGGNLGCSKKSVQWPEGLDFGYISEGRYLKLTSSNNPEKQIIVGEISIDNSYGGRWCWSPFGDQVAFFREDRVYIASRDGATTCMGEYDGLPLFSPDWQMIAYIEEIPVDELPADARNIMQQSGVSFKRLIIKNLETGQTQTVGEGDIQYYDWNYNGEKLVYTNTLSTRMEFDRVVLYDRTTKQEEILLQGGEKVARYGTVRCSPKDSLIGLSISTGSHTRKLSIFDYEKKELYDIPLPQSVGGFSWSPIGNKLLVVAEKSSQEGGVNEIIIMDLLGNTLTSLSYDDPAFSEDEGAGSNHGARYSPDETKVSFTRYCDANMSETDIYVWNTSRDIKLSNGNIQHDIERLTHSGRNEDGNWNMGTNR